MMNHGQTVRAIAGQLKERPRGTRVSFIRNGVSHKVPNAHGADGKSCRIHVGKLDRILDIDPENRICTAESGAAFVDVVRETLKHGLVPYTVPELKTITIGGAVSGCSVESMSYKYGGFHDSCLEYELITADGDVMTCTPSDNAELFNMLHGSFGTLGIITKIKFKLHPAKPFVKLTHVKYGNLEEYQRAINEEYEQKRHDFMDGIIHSPEHFTLCLGDFVDEAPYASNYEGMKIFYKSTREKEEDFMTTLDYFFRYDTECHWLSRNFGLENPLLRLLFGRFFLSSTNMIKTAKKLRFLFKNLKPDVIVDVFVPMSRFKKFYEFYEKEFNYFPLWIVPYKVATRYDWINETFMKDVPDKLFIDCAIYGLRQKDRDYYKLMDEKLLELKGLKTLISHNSYDQETFWKIYNRDRYARIKKLTDPENIFRDLYQKTHSR